MGAAPPSSVGPCPAGAGGPAARLRASAQQRSFTFVACHRPAARRNSSAASAVRPSRSRRSPRTEGTRWKLSMPGRAATACGQSWRERCWEWRSWGTRWSWTCRAPSVVVALPARTSSGVGGSRHRPGRRIFTAGVPAALQTAGRGPHGLVRAREDHTRLSLPLAEPSRRPWFRSAVSRDRVRRDRGRRPAPGGRLRRRSPSGPGTTAGA